MKRKSIVVMNIIFILVSASVFAQEKNHIELKNEVFKEQEIIKEDGSKEFKLVPPGKAVPGDEIIYVITFTNVGDEEVSDITITDPIPNSSLYKSGSAFGAGTEITFSVDGGAKYDKPELLKVKGEDGELRTAMAKEYTNIKWVFKNILKPAAEGTVTFRTILK